MLLCVFAYMLVVWVCVCCALGFAHTLVFLGWVVCFVFGCEFLISSYLWLVCCWFVCLCLGVDCCVYRWFGGFLFDGLFNNVVFN